MNSIQKYNEKLQLTIAESEYVGRWGVEVLKQEKTSPLSDEQIEGYVQKWQNITEGTRVEAQEAVYKRVGIKYETIADFDSFISVNGSHQTDIVQNAIEKGSFRSVNKIRKPNIFTVELAKGGDSVGVELVLSNLKKYQGSTDLVRIVTPFGYMENLNITKMDYNFTSDGGRNLLIAKLTLQEVLYGNVSESYTLQKVKSPTNTNINNIGRVAKRSWK